MFFSQSFKWLAGLPKILNILSEKILEYPEPFTWLERFLRCIGIFSEDIYALNCTWSGRFGENTFWVHAEEIFFHEKRNTFYSPPFDMIRRIGRKYILTSPYPRFTLGKFLSRKRKLLFLRLYWLRSRGTSFLTSVLCWFGWFVFVFVQHACIVYFVSHWYRICFFNYTMGLYLNL